MYMMFSGLVDHGLSLQIPDVLPASVAGNYYFTSGICNLRPRPTSPEDILLNIFYGSMHSNDSSDNILMYITMNVNIVYLKV